MSRQNYYKRRQCRRRQEIDEELVLSLVRRERQLQPRLGARKLAERLSEELAAEDVQLGRDRLFGLLRRNGLLIERRRVGTRTTWSGHGWGVYENLVQDLELTAPHQVLVSDITYLRTQNGFLYLCLVMDSFSRAIVGWDCSDSLEAEGALRALSMSLKQLPSGGETIHHSDRGSQYCCQEYVSRLRAAAVRISMTQENHCYENSRAERLNGILKQEYGLGGTFGSKAEAQMAVAQAVLLYNHCRPHQSLGYRLPMQVHESAA